MYSKSIYRTLYPVRLAASYFPVLSEREWFPTLLENTIRSQARGATTDGLFETFNLSWRIYLLVDRPICQIVSWDVASCFMSLSWVLREQETAFSISIMKESHNRCQLALLLAQ